MLKTLFYSICIFLCVIFSTSSINAADYFSNALRIYSEGQFFAASIEFERAIFNETDNIKIAQCKYYKSICYRELGENTKALEELTGVNAFNLPDSLFFLIRYETAFCNFLNNDPNQSLLNIEELRIKFPDTLKTADIIPLNILCLNDLRKWEEALALWNYFLENSSLQGSVINDFKKEVGKLYDEKNIPKYKSPKTAENLSRFIPGSGQMYCGAFLEGTFNLLMNASLLGYAGFEFYNHYYFTGYFVGLGLFNKTYNGGMHRANLLAAETNIERLTEFNRQNSLLLIDVLKFRHSELTSINSLSGMALVNVKNPDN
jgi:hypothetical protein